MDNSTYNATESHVNDIRTDTTDWYMALPQSAVIAFAAVEFSIAIWTILSNSTVIITFIKTKPQNVTNTDVLIFSLALTDIFCGLVAIPYGIVMKHLTRLVPGLRRAVLFSRYACLGQVSTMVFMHGLSLLHTPVIAAERCLVLCSSRKFSARLTRRLTNGIAVGCWVYAAILGVLPVFWVSRWVPGSQCRADNVYHDFMTYVLLPHIPISFITSCVLYLAIIASVTRQRRKIAVWSAQMTEMTTESTAETALPKVDISSRPTRASGRVWSLNRSKDLKDTSRSPGFRGLTKHQWESQVRLAKMTGTIMFVFMMSWLPYTAVYIATKNLGRSSTCLEVLRVVAVEMSELNSGINPIVYAFMSKRFRDACKRTIKCLG
ncbi:octopamine receptor beta-2R-like [Lingula anatina]|uniref:Octopamine receptor beta-2R-like n=1 Tax=Lingula anatina TaxID=7574 RepID=A0A1S3H152_LINAN|nr:octopamine receptor beta-2R-like [Lingula anatina]|eukprot:XP_013379211.1 octopamine receptor beta-2R-like [Lingula anatina]